MDGKAQDPDAPGRRRRWALVGGALAMGLCAVALFVWLGARAVVPECQLLLNALDTCDPTAPEMPVPVRAWLLVGCPTRCAHLPTGDAAQCAAFMGCVYGD